MEQGSVSRTSYLTVAAIVTIGLLCWRLFSTSETLKAERQQTRDLATQFRVTTSERNDAIEVINRLPAATPFLEGTLVGDSSHVRFDKPIDAVFYIIEVTCPFCGENDSLLHQLDEAKIPVVIIALDGDFQALKTYVAFHKLRGRALVDVSGSFRDRLPVNSVPRTVVMRSGSIRVLITGKIDSAGAKTVADSVIKL